MTTTRLLFCFLITFFVSCSNSSPDAKWIFGLSKNTLPSELEDNGFETTNDDGPHCILDHEDIFVSIGYTTSNKMEHCGITTSTITFSEVSSIEVKDYDSVMIQNQPYKIKHYKESNEVFASRLGL